MKSFHYAIQSKSCTIPSLSYMSVPLVSSTANRFPSMECSRAFASVGISSVSFICLSRSKRWVRLLGINDKLKNVMIHIIQLFTFDLVFWGTVELRVELVELPEADGVTDVHLRKWNHFNSDLNVFCTQERCKLKRWKVIFNNQTCRSVFNSIEVLMWLL